MVAGTRRPAGARKYVGMRPCRRCGTTDPQRMYALMHQWFGRFAELPPEPGYFYLCPRCHEELVVPHEEEILERVAEHHPAALRAQQKRALDNREASRNGAQPASSSELPEAEPPTPPEASDEP